ncbi:MAG: DUF4091 domain-containing protein [Planctomycetes bacterium]|nr:DUF4091 domain-containing protein [Planctomycetota bacterium]
MKTQKKLFSPMVALACLGFCGCIVATRESVSPGPPGTRVWAAGSTEKIQRVNRSELPHSGVWDEMARRVRLEGVRGEHVPFQLVVTADRIDLKKVTVEVSELRCAEARIPADSIKIYLEYLSKVYAPSGKNGRKGYWPDALVPLTRPFDIRSSHRGRGPVLRNQPLWIDVVVPAGQRPGVYEGSLTVKADGEELGTLALELKVWNVTLGKERHFPVQFGFFYGREIARIHGVEQGSDEYRELFFEYLGYMLDHRVDPAFISIGLAGGVKDGKYVLEWTDPRMEKFLFERGQCRFLVGAGPPGLSRDGLTKEQYEEYVRQYLRQVIAHARESGWYERLSFTGAVDEPQTKKEYEAVRYWADLIHSVDPKVPVAVTEQPLPDKAEWGTLVGYCSEWIVHGNMLDKNREAIAARQAAGERVSWYISCDQLYPQPNYYIDRSAADCRMISWITWRYRLGGMLYWATTLWREVRDPWGDAVSWKRSHCNAPAAGEGMLLYPGNLVEKYTGQKNVYGPVGSLRFALLREGLEELELLEQLSALGGRAEADAIAASICNGVKDFSRDPNEIEAARHRLIRAIVARQEGRP